MVAGYVTVLVVLSALAGWTYSAGAIGLALLIATPLWLLHRHSRAPANIVYFPHRPACRVVDLSDHRPSA